MFPFDCTQGTNRLDLLKFKPQEPEKQSFPIGSPFVSFKTSEKKNPSTSDLVFCRDTTDKLLPKTTVGPFIFDTVPKKESSQLPQTFPRFTFDMATKMSSSSESIKTKKSPLEIFIEEKKAELCTNNINKDTQSRLTHLVENHPNTNIFQDKTIVTYGLENEMIYLLIAAIKHKKFNEDEHSKILTYLLKKDSGTYLLTKTLLDHDRNREELYNSPDKDLKTYNFMKKNYLKKKFVDMVEKESNSDNIMGAKQRPAKRQFVGKTH
jgi:hypothetical protein